LHPDDLKTIWECHDCGRKFFYHSDMLGHIRDFRHSKVISRDYAKRTRGSVFIRKTVALWFNVDGKRAKLEIECKYYPSTESIVYVNVNYSNKKLQGVIEDKPEMMSRVDRYLRQLFRSKTAEGSH
jgi:hypothetical protein